MHLVLEGIKVFAILESEMALGLKAKKKVYSKGLYLVKAYPFSSPFNFSLFYHLTLTRK
jgi:hypothetical protein